MTKKPHRPTKKQIATNLAYIYGVRVWKAQRIIQGFMDAVLGTIETTGRIELRNFGVFHVREGKASKRVKIQVNGRCKRIQFRASPNVKKRLQRSLLVQNTNNGRSQNSKQVRPVG